MTDWDAYYGSVPRYTSLARQFSQRKIISYITECFGDRSVSICELGGANSCFVEGISRTSKVDRYHVIDKNQRGLTLLKARRPNCYLTWERGDVLTPYTGTEQFDFVYSVGLVEHFDVAGTFEAIRGHFSRCRNGGIVLLTFPTPTLPYRAIRRIAEAMSKWNFPDERPLTFGEVISDCSAHGKVIHCSTNWWIGLTQGYVGTRKDGHG